VLLVMEWGLAFPWATAIRESTNLNLKPIVGHYEGIFVKAGGYSNILLA
jgi:hypothetical protein